jgi:hypothetical protein
MKKLNIGDKFALFFCGGVFAPALAVATAAGFYCTWSNINWTEVLVNLLFILGGAFSGTSLFLALAISAPLCIVAEYWELPGRGWRIFSIASVILVFLTEAIVITTIILSREMGWIILLFLLPNLLSFFYQEIGKERVIGEMAKEILSMPADDADKIRKATEVFKYYCNK